MPIKQGEILFLCKIYSPSSATKLSVEESCIHFHGNESRTGIEAYTGNRSGYENRVVSKFLK